MTLDTIKNLIRLNSAPYWRLSLVSGVTNTTAGVYNCENLPDTATDEQRVAGSIAFLDSYMSHFENSRSQHFAIEMRKTKTANGSSVFGWFPFSLEKPSEQQAIQGVQGLGALPVSIDEKLEQLRKSMLLEFEQKEFERQKLEFAQYKKDEKTALKSEWEKVKRKSAPIENAFEKVLSGVVMPMLGFQPEPSLGAIDAVDDEPNGAVETERERKIKEIAQKMFDSPLNDQQLESVLNQIPCAD